MPHLDHVILHTTDIERAAADFAAAGFTVQTRDDAVASHGTESRFVVFRDGAYLLLMEFRDPARKKAHRLSRFLETDTGLVDYGIRVDESETARCNAADLGLEPTEPMEMRSHLRCGAEWGVRLFTPGRGAARGDDALPFVVQDLGPHETRVPAFRPHTNGLESISAVRVESADADRTADLLARVAGIAPEAGGTSVRLGQTEIIFLQRQPGAAGSSGEGGVIGLDLSGSAIADETSRDMMLQGARLSIPG